MEETRVVYKRNSAWWFATCYLAGTFFLLCYGLLAVAGAIFDIGSGGIHMLKEASKRSDAQLYVASKIRKDIYLVSYNVITQDNKNKISVSIKNGSPYTIEHVQIEIAYLDQKGAPVNVQNLLLSSLAPIYPGDTAHAHIETPVQSQYSSTNISARITQFDVVDKSYIQSFCKDPETNPKT